MSFFVILSNKNQGIKVWLATFITAFLFVYIFYASSRATWIATIVEICLFLSYLIIHRKKLSGWFKWSSNKTSASIAGILLIICLINFSSSGYTNFLTVSSDNISSISESASNASSPRYQIWKVTSNIFLDSPIIGHGLGSFSQSLANEGFATWNINNTFRAHNDILELAVELGAIGVIILFVNIIFIIHGVLCILKHNNSDTNVFFYLVFVSLTGSFINLLFSFPYQMPVPLIIFGLYCSLIAKQLDVYLEPVQSFSILISKQFKQICILVLISSLSILYFNTYGKWITAYDKLDRINQLGELDQIDTLETPIHYSGMQQTLYQLGGKYFNKGDYHRSKSIDNHFLKIWPNHLDVLFRVAYAKNKVGQNNEALELTKKLKKLEPNGLYNGFIVEMFIYLSTNELDKLELTFNELISKPEEFLKLNDDTYRFLIYFTLGSKNLYKFAPILYEKYIANHGYSCEVENNLAIHYFNLEQYYDSSKHVNNTFGKDRDCLNPKLIKLLEEIKLTESQLILNF
jgi:hypothetical protein